MIDKRVGKDLQFRWPITINGKVETLTGMNLKLQLRTPLMRVVDLSFTSAGNILSIPFPASVQKGELGVYHLTLWRDYDDVGRTAVDAKDAVNLVSRSYMEGDNTDGLDSDDPIELPVGNIEVGIMGPRGERGEQGLPGKDGKDGAKGDKGDTGAQGPRGYSGNINYPRMSVDKNMHLRLHADAASDEDRFELNKGHLILKI